MRVESSISVCELVHDTYGHIELNCLILAILCNENPTSQVTFFSKKGSGYDNNVKKRLDEQNIKLNNLYLRE